MRIRELTLYTTDPQRQLAFYQAILGMECLDAGPYHTTLLAGSTVLRFKHRPDATPYHFAFNIPPGTEEELLRQIRGRVILLRHEGHELIDFPAWEARSIYFYDPDYNIVECIARKNLSWDKAEHQGIIGISEIGMPVEDISQAYEMLSRLHPLSIYDGSFDRFCAVGDENGLLILVDRNRKTWFPTNDRAYSSPFGMQGDFQFFFEEGKVLPFKGYHQAWDFHLF